MAVKEIIKTTNDKQKVINIPSILITKCEKVVTFDKNLKNIAQDLIDTANMARNPEAAGLAAPQIGYNKAVCLVKKLTYNKDTLIKSEDIILVNPKIIKASNSTTLEEEGCLSIPQISGKVQRSKTIKIEAFNILGEKIKFEAKDYYARVIQHEIDHLNGILFTSKVIGSTHYDAEE